VERNAPSGLTVVSTVHLISGLPCSGKTSYALALRADKSCVLFCLDRWLITAFGRYAIGSIGHEEHTRRVLACRELIWEASAELLRRAVDVVLDDGFFMRGHRIRCVNLAKAVGADAKIHFIDTPLSVIEARLDRRNASLPPYNFHIDPEMLHGFLQLFEEPSAEEGAEVVVVRDLASHPSRADREA